MRALLAIIILCPFLSMCQAITIKGKIINEQMEPVTGATITLQRPAINGSQPSSIITRQISDASGEFSLPNVWLTDTLVITAIGYETATETPDFNSRGHITIILKRKSALLDEVVINTGYQQLPKERVTGSFETISNHLLNRQTGAGVLNRLEGISSLYFDKRGLGNGGISLRGRSTIFGNASPLVIVDNFPFEGNLNDINPNDVESITLLKDAAATSIWGVKAGNGVIVITMKKGRYSTSPRMEFNANTTVVARPNLYYAPAISSSDFIDMETFLFNKGFYNGDINNLSTHPPLTPVIEMLILRKAGQLSGADSAAQINAWRSFDLRKDLDKYFYRTGAASQYSISISGGAPGLTYHLSAGYDKNRSYQVGNSGDRFTIRSYTSCTPFKNLEVYADINFTRSANTFNNTATSLAVGSKKIYPYARLADGQGNSLPVVKDYRLSFTDTAGGGQLLKWNYKPLEELQFADNNSTVSAARLAFGASWHVNSNWEAQLKYQLENESGERKNLYSQQTYFTRNLINRFYNPNAVNKYAVPLGGIADWDYSKLMARAARAQLNYNQQWSANHQLTAIAGAEIRESHNLDNSYRLYGYNDELLTYTNVNLADNLPVFRGLAPTQPIPNPASASEGLLHFVSTYANAAYTFQQRYSISASARKDASNLFGVQSNQKGVPLWSAGAAWLVSNEKFYSLAWLPYLKLRTTYGYSGNVDNTLSALATIKYTTGALFTNQPYAMLQNPPNPELGWEKIRTWNIAADFNALKGRLEATMEYYRKKGEDLVGLSPLDPTTGVQSSLQAFAFKGNVASMKGTGFDLVLTTHNLVRRFKWTTNIILGYSKNEVENYKVTDVNAAAYLNLGTTISPVPGRPVFALYSYQWAGLDPATGDPQGFLNNQLSKDFTALANVQLDKLQYSGPALPVTFGSIRNNFSWKSFDCSFNIVYKLGYFFRRNSINYTSLFQNWSGHSDYAARWQKPGDERTTIVPSMIYPNPNTNRDAFYSFSSVLIEKGDHVRLQDVSLSYEWKKEKDNHLPFKSIRLYLYTNNLGILWKANKSGLDPDYFSGGYPVPRSLSLGINANL